VGLAIDCEVTVADIMRGASIRLRTTLIAVTIVAAAFITGAAALVAVLQQQLITEIDTALRTRLDDLQTASAGGIRLPASLPDTGDEGRVVQIVGSDGVVITQSANIKDRIPLIASSPAGITQIRTIEQAPIGDTAAYRLAVRRIVSSDHEVAVVVGSSLDPSRESVQTLRRSLLRGIPLLLLLVGVVTWFAAGRVLAPVESIRATMADISASDLSQRVPEPTGRDEISRLARTMNQTLDRLQAASDKQRAFVSDASHEFRTPLASLQAQLDVLLANPQQIDRPHVVRRLHDDGRRLQHLAEDLLFLAVHDDGQRIPERALVDLDELVINAVEPIRARNAVKVDISKVEGGRVLGDASQLTRLLANLLDNAEQHAVDQISVELHTTDATVELVITDDGPGIPAVDRERIFERFTRLDDARRRPHGGAGLGLSIVKSIADAHHATIVVADSNHGARIVVTLATAAA
jgi:signal transduction histidine kinase